MRYLVLFAFFFSGFASLVLENIWVRMMTLVFGGTTLAVVTVLSAFMGGIALGSYIAGKWIARTTRPIALYGALECIVAIYALLLPFVINLLPQLYNILPVSESLWGMAFLRFACCTLLLLLPTTMMGATLPVLSHFFVRGNQQIGVETGLLYGMNTLGAVAGALFGGFVMLPLFGHQKSLWITSALLGCLGLLMIFVGRRLVLPKTTQVQAPSSAAKATRQGRLAMWLLGLTGALAMVCQVIWSRTLAMVIGSSTYAFSLLLGLFLIGLALGSLWGARRLKKSQTPRRDWFLMLMATAISVALGIWVMDMLPLWFAQLVIQLKGYNNPILLFAIKALIAALPIFLPTFFMGTFFPYALALYSADNDTVGEDVGRVYAANTLGAIIGSASAGFVVIPLIGLQYGLAMCVGLYLFSAWCLYALQSIKKAVPFAATTIVCCVAVFSFPTWNQGWMSLGMFRVSAHQFDQGRGIPSPGKMLFYKEGMSATVSVHGNGNRRSLRVNGKTDASSHGDWLTQVGIAVMPLLAHKNPKDVALIGWGSGITAGAALHFPLRSLTAIELEPAVIEGSRYFQEWNFQPWNDKRLKLLTNDGRNYLAANNNTFDVIISEPSNPWISGQANLFTREYFQLTRKRLRPQGIFCQWVQFYELSYKNILLILQTLHSVYPYVYMFEPEFADSDKILLASQTPLRLDRGLLLSKMSRPALRKLLSTVQIRTPRDILARYILGGEGLKSYLASKDKTINTDGHNKLEFSAPLDLVRKTTSSDASDLGGILRKHGKETALTLYGQPKGTLDLPTTGKEWLDKAVSSLLFGNLAEATQQLKIAQQLDPTLGMLSKRFHWLLALSKARMAPELRAFSPNTGAEKKLWKALQQARHAYQRADYQGCTRLLAPWQSTQSALLRKVDQAYLYMAYCAFEQNKYTQALTLYGHYRFSHLKTPSTPQKTPGTTTKRAPPKAPEKAAGSTTKAAQKKNIAATPALQPSTKPVLQAASRPVARSTKEPVVKPVTRPATSRPAASRPSQ